jgi:hypothetical protein
MDFSSAQSRYVPNTCYPPWFDPGEEYRLWNSSLCSFAQFIFISFLLGLNVFLSTLKHFQVVFFFFSVRGTKFYTQKMSILFKLFQRLLWPENSGIVLTSSWCMKNMRLSVMLLLKVSDGKIILCNKITRDRKIRHVTTIKLILLLIRTAHHLNK